MQYKRIIAGLLLAISAIAAYSFIADDDVVTRVQRKLDEWTDVHPIEKVHLHLDKPYYSAGDDIWFKAYVITGPQHLLQPDSGILNVELIDAQDSVKQELKLQLKNGLAYGDFALPDTLHQGNYRIRAYTQYMLNAGPEYFFDKTISIANAITEKVYTKATFNTTDQNGRSNVTANINFSGPQGEAYTNSEVTYSLMIGNKVIQKGKATTNASGDLQLTLPADNEAVLRSGRIVTRISAGAQGAVYRSIPIRVMAATADVQFFAEGGNMINGIPARVAFKAIGTNGLGIAITGTVVNSKGTIITPITASHLGMGEFEFTPQGGETYKARVTYQDGSTGVVNLPAATNNGYVMHVADSGPENLKITIAAKNAGQFAVIGQSAGKVYFSAKSTPGSNMFTATVAKNKFPSGIAQFTLFSSAGQPMNERLVFIQSPEDKLNLAINADKQSYATRQKVQLNVSATDSEGKPVVSSLSVAVTNESKVPVNEDNEANIFADLLLTGDLKGYIEQPAYYFNNINDKTRADLDVLMLTQGYHRLEWKDVLNDNSSALRYAPQSTFTISGRVATPFGAPVPNGTVELINFDDGLLKLDTRTDANGRFAFTNILFVDSIKFLIQARTAKNKRDVVIKMDSVPAPQALVYKNAPDITITDNGVNIYAQSSKDLYNAQLRAGVGNHVITLQEVKIRDRRLALKHSSNLNGPGNADQIFLAKDFYNMGCPQLSDCLQGRLLGVNFRNGIPFSTRGGGRMLVVIDGLRVPGSATNNLNVNDVQSIEVLRNPGTFAIYGMDAGNGVLVITTKRGDEPTYYPETFGRGIIPYQPKGILRARTFYSPKYDARTVQKLADLRTTIFWKPDVLTRGGTANIEYFNAGSPGNYRVVVEGIDSEGNIGRQIFRYKVVN